VITIVAGAIELLSNRREGPESWVENERPEVASKQTFEAGVVELGSHPQFRHE
jgi:hypothetical protein